MDEAGPREALLAFLRAFENCDLTAMEAAFAEEADGFDRIVMSPGQAAPIEPQAHRRADGMPAGMRRLAETLPNAGGAAPYHRLEPRDLRVTVTPQMALCTFHLVGEGSLARRTIVMVPRAGRWKILHVHASNVAAQ